MKGLAFAMNILIVNTFFYPDLVGGTEHSINILSKQLARRGHNVAVYCFNTREKKFVKEKIGGIVVYRGQGGAFNIQFKLNEELNRRRKIRNKLIEINNFWIDKEFKEIISDFHPTIVHSNNLNGFSTRIWKLASSCNIPILHTLRDYWILSPKYNTIDEEKTWFKLFCKIIYQPIMKRYASKVKVVSAPSEYVIAGFKEIKFFKNASYISVPNCVEIDEDSLCRSVANKMTRKTLEITFLYIGKLSSDKGVKTLIKAFEMLLQKNVTVRLLICGKGPLKEWIKEKVMYEHRIDYKGQLEPSKLVDIYDEADVLVVPSEWKEPFGRVVIEGMLHGCAVIGADSGGIPEIINRMGCGKIFQSGNIDELVDKMLFFTNRKNITREICQIPDNMWKYSEITQVTIFEKLYEQLQ